MKVCNRGRLPGIVLLLITLVLSGGFASGGAEGASGSDLSVDFWTAPNQGQFDFWSAKAEAFNQAGVQVEGKSVYVNVQMMPETPSSEAGIQNALATGVAPAASENINRGFAATLAASGRVYELSDIPEFQAVVQARQMESILPGWAIDGGQYVIPLYANAMGYHWNVQGLKALGFDEDVPRTVAEIRTLITRFYERRQALKEQGISHLFIRPQLLRPEWWWDRWFDFQMQYLAFSEGGDWVSGDRITLDPGITEEVFEYFGMFGQSLQTAEDWTAFEMDTVPVVFQVSAPWDIPKYEAAGKVYGFGGDYVYGPPIVKQALDQPYTFADSKGIVFYKGGNISDLDHQGILAFISWVLTGERGAQTDIDWVKTTGMLPVRGDLLENPAFESIIASNPAYAYQAEVMPYAVPAMAHEKMVDIQTALGEKGLTPYIQSIMNSTSLNPADAAPFVHDAFEAMKREGELR
ncbi:ABC transporter substrate-binding protein [Spirochaeta lutea]|uniref:Sugar ABC transporter substrate-binding protein n=1 Tax=Spirochaeta lutea TaxID=1480694 RepID=A0A098QTY4_9SPIO|nr:ABC transporter substrate-binding protein [Spirochaeta lutea]KGE70813.1 hypothetical protein DC28_15115 [Spirochaeta lutea]